MDNKLPTETEFRRFLLDALMNTYAGGGGESKPVLTGTKQLAYARDGLRYVDVYAGFDPYQGMSIVTTDDGRTLWTMTYMGFCQNASRDEAKAIYDFLKEARLAAYRDGHLFELKPIGYYVSNDRRFAYTDKVSPFPPRMLDGHETVLNNIDKKVVYMMQYVTVMHVELQTR